MTVHGCCTWLQLGSGGLAQGAAPCQRLTLACWIVDMPRVAHAPLARRFGGGIPLKQYQLILKDGVHMSRCAGRVNCATSSLTLNRLHLGMTAVLPGHHLSSAYLASRACSQSLLPCLVARASNVTAFAHLPPAATRRARLTAWRRTATCAAATTSTTTA